MGINPRKPIGYDDHCAFCFPAGQTPTEVKVFVGGLAKAQFGDLSKLGEYNGYHDVTTNPGVTCSYRNAPGGDLEIRFTYGNPIALLSIGLVAGGSVFFSGGMPQCSRWYENHNNFIGNAFWRGWAYVCPAIELEEMAGKVMNPALFESNYDLFPLDNEEIVLRVARIADATNVKFKIDTSV